jgi:hypothetical protein
MTEHMRILKMIEEGEISPEEGARLLQEVGSSLSEEKLDSLSILAKIDRGEISAEEGIALLESDISYSEGGDNFVHEEPFSQPPPGIPAEEIAKWQRWWTIPLYVGVGIVILSAVWLNSAYQKSGFGVGFFCSWVPLLIGVLLIALAWRSQSGPWIHVRVRGPNENVAVSIPAPLGIAGWVLRNFGQFIPQLERTTIDEILVALDTTSKDKAPLYVVVDEGDQGEYIEIFIG